MDTRARIEHRYHHQHGRTSRQNKKVRENKGVHQGNTLREKRDIAGTVVAIVSGFSENTGVPVCERRSGTTVKKTRG
jgi:hypothetical protein